MTTVHHRYATVDGRRLFYREAGPAGAPAVVLLHGFPASSFMFRNLIPLLADRYHVIAPDHLGFGLSDAPPAGEFTYTFGGLAGLTAALLVQLRMTRYAMYVQDYGAPVGWRLALANPAAVTAIVTQNGNGYEAGFTEGFWKPVREYWAEQRPETEAAVRQALTLEAIRWQYLHGVPDETVVSPDTWYHDFALVSRPGNDLVQLQLFADYASNLPLYPRLHAYLRDSRVPLLAVWGANDEIFGPDGARAFAADAPRRRDSPARRRPLPARKPPGCRGRDHPPLSRKDAIVTEKRKDQHVLHEGPAMPGRPIIVFDVNETLLDLDALRPTFDRIFGDPAALRLWFANLITYSEALTLAGVYVPFTDIGGAVLRMLAATCGITTSDAAELTDRVATIPPHPEVPAALRRLRGHGFRLFTLTDNTLEISGRQLERAGVIDVFERRFSVDETVRRYKPAPEAYQSVAAALGAEPGGICLVASHVWDTIGAVAAGWQAALILREGNAPLGVGPQPNYIGEDLDVIADQLIGRYAAAAAAS